MDWEEGQKLCKRISRGVRSSEGCVQVRAAFKCDCVQFRASRAAINLSRAPQRPGTGPQTRTPRGPEICLFCTHPDKPPLPHFTHTRTHMLALPGRHCVISSPQGKRENYVGRNITPNIKK